MKKTRLITLVVLFLITISSLGYSQSPSVQGMWDLKKGTMDSKFVKSGTELTYGFWVMGENGDSLQFSVDSFTMTCNQGVGAPKEVASMKKGFNGKYCELTVRPIKKGDSGLYCLSGKNMKIVDGNGTMMRGSDLTGTGICILVR